MGPRAELHSGMWATVNEQSDEVIGLYRRVRAHSDETIDSFDLDSESLVSHRSADRQTTPHRVPVRMIADTHRHAGHADVVRESVYGFRRPQVGNDNMASRGAHWWAENRSRVQVAAYRRRNDSLPQDCSTSDPSSALYWVSTGFCSHSQACFPRCSATRHTRLRRTTSWYERRNKRQPVGRSRHARHRAHLRCLGNRATGSRGRGDRVIPAQRTSVLLSLSIVVAPNRREHVTVEDSVWNVEDTSIHSLERGKPVDPSLPSSERYPMNINDDDITTTGGAGEGPADGGSNPNGHDGGADGTAGPGEGPADGGSNPGGHDGGADGPAGSGEGPADGGSNPSGHDGGADGAA